MSTRRRGQQSSSEMKENGSTVVNPGPVPPPPIDSLGEQTTYAQKVMLPKLFKSAVASINAEWILVLSLWLMAGQSLYYYYELSKESAPLVTLLPFILSIFGASVGAVWESNGFPLVLKNLIQGIRVANVPAVTAAISFATLAQAFPTASESVVRLVVIGLLLYTASVSLVAMSAGPSPLLIVQMMVEIAVAAAIAIFYSPLASTTLVRSVLGLRALFQVLGFLDPSAGTIFHFLNIAAGYYLFKGLHDTPVSLASQWVAQLSAFQLFLHASVAIIAVVLVLRFFKPQLYSSLRFLFNDVIWQSIYAGLLAMPAWYPQPMREEIYASNPRVEFVTYGSTHKRASLYEFSAASFIPKSQQIFNEFLVNLIFAFIRFFDTFFPQARTNVPLADKQRVTGSYANYFPAQLAGIVGGASKQRETVLEWRAKGQMLAYVVNYGHASTMLAAGDKADEVIMDLNFMSEFEPKKDFVKYGGIARFRVNRDASAASSSASSTSSDDSQTNFVPLLELVSISVPSVSSRVLKVPESASDPALTNPQSEFRKAEAVLLASAIANCVIAKHCAGIHSYFNLIAVSLHNAFDTQPWLSSGSAKYPHPIRLALMPHFYNHVIVEEVTTPHLLERYAVFPQIFNFTDKGLAAYYDRQFEHFELNSDADLKGRLAILGLDEAAGAKLDQKSGTIAWEVEYHSIFLQYCTMMVQATYQNSTDQDAAVKADPLIRRLEKELKTALPNKKLPKRYGGLDTVDTLSRFMADTIFCVCIRHHIYGVNSSHYSDDWNSVPNQVPADFGVPAVEDYMSQLYVALATTRPSYILWKSVDVAHRWNYLLAPLAQTVPEVYAEFANAFDWLQKQFDSLQAKYTANAVEQLVNFELNRPVPSELCPGSAY